MQVYLIQCKNLEGNGSIHQICQSFKGVINFILNDLYSSLKEIEFFAIPANEEAIQEWITEIKENPDCIERGTACVRWCITHENVEWYYEISKEEVGE